MFNCLCINDLFALQRYKNFWTFLLFSLCFKALSTIYMQVGNFSFISLVLSFPFRLFPKMFLPNRLKSPLNTHKIGSNKPDYWQKMSKFEPINK